MHLQCCSPFCFLCGVSWITVCIFVFSLPLYSLSLFASDYHFGTFEVVLLTKENKYMFFLETTNIIDPNLYMNSPF